MLIYLGYKQKKFNFLNLLFKSKLDFFLFLIKLLHFDIIIFEYKNIKL